MKWEEKGVDARSLHKMHEFQCFIVQFVALCQGHICQNRITRYALSLSISLSVSLTLVLSFIKRGFEDYRFYEILSNISPLQLEL